MGYASLAECVADLRASGQLFVFDEEVAAELEVSAIQRRLFRCGGPAILFTRVRGCAFPMLGNMYGTEERARYVLRHGYRAVEQVIGLKARPKSFFVEPHRKLGTALQLPNLLPRRVSPTVAPVLRHRASLSQLPRHISWPGDGGPFITLPQVYSEDPKCAGWMRSNLGMYRVQLEGNEYQRGRQIGLHYQLHRGIGIHHTRARKLGVPLHVNIFVGGPPALALAAVMPLPEGLPELSFAGLLGGRGVRLTRCPESPLALAAEADFVIVGRIHPDLLLPEGPFGDHLGYYSLRHDFPVLEVDAVYHRPEAIWPFTTVGRPPQEDTIFGRLIHELTAPALPSVLPGVTAVHAVDAAGVHPLLLAQARERYTPYQDERRPQEILTAASAILGQGQLSLAKYLFIVSHDDDPFLDIHDIPAFFQHLLERVDWRSDLHFRTQTNYDTLDYSSGALHRGSKLVAAAAGPVRRALPCQLPELRLGSEWTGLGMVMPGVLTLSGPAYQIDRALGVDVRLRDLAASMPPGHPFLSFPLWVIADNAEFCAASLNNWLWVTFTRSNPAADVYGVGEFIHQKHWGCTGPLIIDARSKPHHAPVLEEDPEVARKVEAWAAPHGPLHGLF